jgi:hypothetical protein
METCGTQLSHQVISISVRNRFVLSFTTSLQDLSRGGHSSPIALLCFVVGKIVLTIKIWWDLIQPPGDFYISQKQMCSISHRELFSFPCLICISTLSSTPHRVFFGKLTFARGIIPFASRISGARSTTWV